MVPSAARKAGGVFLVLFGLLLCRCDLGKAYRLCKPDEGNLRQHIFRECHDAPLWGQFGRHTIDAKVLQLAY